MGCIKMEGGLWANKLCIFSVTNMEDKLDRPSISESTVSINVSVLPLLMVSASPTILIGSRL